MKAIHILFSALFILIASNHANGQTITMSNTTINQCAGTLLDPGGAGNYPNNANITTTICPGVPGAFSRLNFTFFDTESTFDNLTIYNGNTVAAPVIGVFSGTLGPFVIQSTNPTGCLTLVFSADANFSSFGFSATISCALPCQAVVAQATSTVPPNVGGFIDVCVGTTLTANGGASYPSPVAVYPQSNATSTFRWDFGDLTSASTQNASHQYNTPGVYDVNLTVTDVNGCSSINDIALRVRVSDTPTFGGTAALNNPICLGQTNDLSGFVDPVELEFFCESSDPTIAIIPDGIGAPYSTTLNLDCFNPGAIITSATDITSICFDLEHSYLHDLQITLTCPNGTTISLYDPSALGIAPVNSVQLGEPVDNDLSATLGDPLTYCFTMSGANDWYSVAEGLVGAVPTHSFIDNDGTSVTNAMYIPAGNYLPTQSLAALAGCPLNGNWTITVIDQLASDNGTVFDISMNFNPNLYSTANNYTPSVTGVWVANPTITANNANVITVTPAALGNPCYTYRATDEFGCVFDTIICFSVIATDNGAFSYSQTTYCVNGTNPSPTITGTVGGTFSATNGLPINPTTGMIDLTLAVAGLYTISYTTPGFTGCPVTTTTNITIGTLVLDFTTSVRTGCAPLVTSFNNTTQNAVSCVWNFGNGSTSNNCGPISQTYNNEGSFSPQLTVTDVNGCTATLIRTNYIVVDPKPIASFVTNPETIPSNDQTVVLNNTSLGATQYSWIFEDNTTSNATSPVLQLNLSEGQQYLVKLFAFSTGGCVDSTLQFLTIRPDLIFYVPNSFTPNGDEYNRSFTPVMTQGFRKDSYNLKIYDRWGGLVFHSQDVSVGWDGTYLGSGKIAQDGIYTYQIDFLINNVDERKSYQGHVNLIR